MTPEDVLVGGALPLVPAVERLEEHREPLGPLGVRARRVQACELRVSQDVDRTISASSPRLVPLRCASPTR
jgi:hypothetical protein